MVLSCHGLCKNFGDHPIIKDASFQIENQEKVALIGVNGAGKTTLLDMLAGERTPDDGQVTLAKDTTLGYLKQVQEFTSNRTVYEEVKTVMTPLLDMELRLRQMEAEMKEETGDALAQKMEAYNRLMEQYERANGYAVESEIAGVLKGLGFTEDDFSKSILTLSGGQKTRVTLAKLLLTKADILLLDEPTNHLDLSSIAWLESYLANYAGAVLIVSHDRYFLDQIVTKVMEIESGTLSVYKGNYTDYADQKAKDRKAQMKAYLKSQQEIQHQEAVIEKLRSFNREKSIKRAQSREKMLDRQTAVEKPATEENTIHFQLAPDHQSGADVLRVEGLSKSYPPQTLFTDVSFDIHRGEHVAIIGENGTGKTTLLRILNERTPADAGSFTLGAQVQIGYYDQEHHVLHKEKTIFEEISDSYPALTNTKIRNVLAAFGFTGDDVFKRIETLSGGERGRVSLARLMLSGANFLILDEPTNHLDIASREVLEAALNDYSGTVLYVSHDRYFINRTASRILELTRHTFINYIGNYDYYLEKREAFTRLYTEGKEASDDKEAPEPSSVKADWQKSKDEQAKARKRKNDLARTEDEIARLEQRGKEINAEMAKEEVYTNPDECQGLVQEKKKIDEQLETLYSIWETLA